MRRETAAAWCAAALWAFALLTLGLMLAWSIAKGASGA